MPDQTFIDLRSDTVTKPSAKMRAAMAAAEVGDDVYGEDPTINRLEQRAAEILGKEAALFVPTGTMGNTIGIKVHTKHGEEVLCDSRSHIVDWELSMMAWFSGCLARMIPTSDGILTWKSIAASLRTKGPHNAPQLSFPSKTRTICRAARSTLSKHLTKSAPRPTTAV